MENDVVVLNKMLCVSRHAEHVDDVFYFRMMPLQNGHLTQKIIRSEDAAAKTNLSLATPGK